MSSDDPAVQEARNKFNKAMKDGKGVKEASAGAKKHLKEALKAVEKALKRLSPGKDRIKLLMRKETLVGAIKLIDRYLLRVLGPFL